MKTEALRDANHKAPLPTYRVDIGMSTSNFGVLWPVVQGHGPCGCGQIHSMERVVGYFTSRQDAEAFVSMATYMEKLAAAPDGSRRV